MQHFLSVVISAACFILLSLLYWALISPRRPKKDQFIINNPTMFDVRRLLKEGDKEAAIRYYSKIFKVSDKQARKDIAELERSLKVR